MNTEIEFALGLMVLVSAPLLAMPLVIGILVAVREYKGRGYRRR